jgi:methylenetetrahydrofolate--tRNA-(uracil-5-)-methyltransferase
VSLARTLAGKKKVVFPRTTAIGSLANYISAFNRNYQPMNITFGLMDTLKEQINSKMKRAEALTERAIGEIKQIAGEIWIPAMQQL